jgi:hypothetical protein
VQDSQRSGQALQVLSDISLKPSLQVKQISDDLQILHPNEHVGISGPKSSTQSPSTTFLPTSQSEHPETSHSKQKSEHLMQF